MATKKEWEVKSYSSQIADTGDYDGHWEISKGDFALITKEDGDDIEDELKKAADLLNYLNLIPDDKHKIDLYIADSRIKEKDAEIERLKATIKELTASLYNF